MRRGIIAPHDDPEELVKELMPKPQDNEVFKYQLRMKDIHKGYTHGNLYWLRGFTMQAKTYVKSIGKNWDVFKRLLFEQMDNGQRSKRLQMLNEC